MHLCQFKDSDEMFPLFIYFPSRHYIPAKVRAFQAFVVDSLPGAQP